MTSRWRRINMRVIAPRIIVGHEGRDGMTHLMGLGQNRHLWVRRCTPDVGAWHTRPGEEINCMACLSTEDATHRLRAGVFHVVFHPRNTPNNLVHQAWAISDFEGMTTCGFIVDLPIDQQVDNAVTCPECLT